MSQEVNSSRRPALSSASLRSLESRAASSDSLPWHARARALGVRWAVGGCRRIAHWLGGSPAEEAEPDVAIGPILGRGDAPLLFEILQALAREAAGAFPSEVRLSYLPACGVLDLGSPQGYPKQVLIVGLPCFQILSVDELTGVLAHELAHLKLEDAVFTQDCMNFLAEWKRRADSRTEWSRWLNPRWILSSGCANGLLLAAAPIARLMECRADRWSAEAVGGRPLARAIEKIALVQPIFREVLSTYDPVIRPAGNAYEFFERAWKRIPSNYLSTWRRRIRDQATTHRLDPHPAIGDRLTRLRQFPKLDPYRPEPALELLVAPEALKQLLHNRLFGCHETPSSVFRRFDG